MATVVVSSVPASTDSKARVQQGHSPNPDDSSSGSSYTDSEYSEDEEECPASSTAKDTQRQQQHKKPQQQLEHQQQQLHLKQQSQQHELGQKPKDSTAEVKRASFDTNGKPRPSEARPQRTAPASTSNSAAAAKGPTATDPFSGLKVAGWRMRLDKWKMLMQRRSYTPLDRIASLDSKNDKDVVVVAALFEKALPRTGGNGNQFVTWGMTDLAFPKPNVITLQLFGTACDLWGLEQEGPVPHASVVAILNPTALPSREESRPCLRVGHSTQVVILGECPSMGFCTATKKDGFKCSLPCDKDRNQHLCYYHNLSRSAQQVKQWQGKPAETRSDVTYLALCAPTTHAKRSSEQSALAQQPGQRGSGLSSSSSARPVATPSGSLHGGRPKAVDPGDAAVAKLLASSKNTPSVPNARQGTSSVAVAASGIRQAVSNQNQMAKTLGDAGQTFVGSQSTSLLGSGPTEAMLGTLVPRSKYVRGVDTQQEQRLAIANLLAKYPNGIPAPDEGGGKALPLGDKLEEGEIVATRVSAGGHVVRKSKKALVPAELKLAQSKVPSYDPRKDAVRGQQSKFAKLVDQEKQAQQHKKLAELEAQDAALEQMEAVMSMTVQAWRCSTCHRTLDSGGAKADCASKSHVLQQVAAVKTKWECSSCRTHHTVFDRTLPASCHCGGESFKQVPLQGKPRTVAMDRDMLLPRGEELKFLNSVPQSLFQGSRSSSSGAPRGQKRGREEEDIYAAL